MQFSQHVDVANCSLSLLLCTTRIVNTTSKRVRIVRIERINIFNMRYIKEIQTQLCCFLSSTLYSFFFCKILRKSVLIVFSATGVLVIGIDERDNAGGARSNILYVEALLKT